MCSFHQVNQIAFVLTGVGFSVFTLIQQEQFMGRVNFTDTLIKGKEIQFELVGIQVIRVQVNQVKKTGKWGEIQGKMNLVRVRREFDPKNY